MKKFKNTPYLIFFNMIDADKIAADEIVSSLQSIEAAFFLIGIEKWPNVIPLLFESLEKLLKHLIQTSKGDTVTSIELINHYKDRYDISNQLIEKAHQLRKLRNELIHRGYSPKDDTEVVGYFFNNAIPLLDNVFTNIFGNNVFGCISKNPSQAWLEDVYKKTRKVITKKINKNDSNLLNGVTLLVMALGKVSRIQNASNFYIEGNEYEIIMQEEYGNIDYEIRMKLYQSHVKEIKCRLSQLNGESAYNYDLLASLEGFKCLRCENESLLGSIKYKSHLEFEKVTSFSCFKCEYHILDLDICNIFINQDLSEKNIERLEGSNLEEAWESMPHGFF